MAAPQRELGVLGHHAPRSSGAAFDEPYSSEGDHSFVSGWNWLHANQKA